MNAALATAIALAIYLLGYVVYSRFLAERVFELRDDEAATPAHVLHDGVDYVPTRAGVLFGHHYASIAGLAPMLGPAVAVIWGWFPAMCWVVLGALLIGCVHDMGALVVSVRARGKSIGVVAEQLLGRRAKTLFHIIIFFLVALAMGVFVFVIAVLFSPPATPEASASHFPQAVVPSFGLMVIAATIGVLSYKRGLSWRLLTPLGFGALLALTWLAGEPSVLEMTGLGDPQKAPGIQGWSILLLAYALAASVLPVWSLLQPRDFLNCLLLYLGLGGLYLGFFLLQPTFQAPALQLDPPGSPGMFPFVFIVIACGAASGFHGLVSSGTTAKQLHNERDARLIGYGGMIGESLLGLIAVLATTAGMMSEQAWHSHYGDWASVQGLGQKVAVFIQGCATFLEALGVERSLGATFVSVIVVSYALTSLDSATRLLRYNIEEISESLGWSWLGNRYVASLAAVAAIGFFAFYKIDGKSAGLTLWALFGTTNQILAALTLLAITLYLVSRRKPWYVTAVPMVLMLTTTVWAMVDNALRFAAKGQWLLLAIGTLLLGLALWLVLEAAVVLRRGIVHEANLDLS